MLTNNKGFVFWIFVFLFLSIGLGIYFGYDLYINKYYITFYDTPKNKYLDVPPFAERITDPSLELLGECDIRFSTIDEQVAHFFALTASKNGFVLNKKGEENHSAFEIYIKKDYTVTGVFEENVLKLRWTPVLTPNLQVKLRKLKAQLAPG